MDRNEDMLATIIGHECAHALARHSAEKISLGLLVTLGVQVGGQQEVQLPMALSV
jgi:Zn-dependent protease with chaperone function